jgi:hypothetical protein
VTEVADNAEGTSNDEDNGEQSPVDDQQGDDEQGDDEQGDEWSGAESSDASSVPSLSDGADDAGTATQAPAVNPGRLTDASAASEAAAETFTPCTDYDCDLAVIRQILDANGHFDIDASAVVSPQGDNTRVTSLSLVDSNNFGSLPGGVSVLPPEIGRLNGLGILFLTVGTVRELPAEMAHLENLRRLDVIEQQLDHFPDVVLQIPSLTSLTLDRMPIADLPKEIANLPQLGSLWMNWTLIERLPDEIAGMTSLSQTSLVGNRLTSLPADIGHLPNVDRLYLGDNQLDLLPESITQLEPSNLSVNNNQLCGVSASVANWLDQYAEDDWDEQQFSDVVARSPCEVVRTAD